MDLHVSHQVCGELYKKAGSLILLMSLVVIFFFFFFFSFYSSASSWVSWVYLVPRAVGVTTVGNANLTNSRIANGNN